MDFIKHKFREEHMAVENSEECKKTMTIKHKRRQAQANKCFPGQRNSVDGHRRALFVHETMATDTNNIKKVFDGVKVGSSFTAKLSYIGPNPHPQTSLFTLTG